MIEQEYLKYCLEKIEEKLGWKPSVDWKESDFVRLSEIISERSNISISPHTLKRLFGKIKYKKYYNPQQATKDALAKYLEFSDWRDFVANLKSERKIASKDGNKSLNSKRLALFFLLFAIVVVAVVFFLGESKSNKTNELADDIFGFSLVDSVGVVPYTVSANYDLSNIKSDSVSIDFGFNHPIRGQQTFLADKSKFVRNFTYQIPGKYFIDLKKENETLSSKTVLAMSEDWESYLTPEIANGDYWIDNKIEKTEFSGSLYYAPAYLDSIGFNTNQVYYITNRLYKEFGIDGDNFELNTRFKSSEALGGITCYDLVFRVIFEYDNSNINLMENGCSQFSGMKIGETVLSGDHDDLSSFKFNLDTWNDLKIFIKDKAAKVYINNNEIYAGDYEETNGKIIGLEVVFKGTGMLDFVHIKDLNTQKEYKDDF